VRSRRRFSRSKDTASCQSMHRIGICRTLLLWTLRIGLSLGMSVHSRSRYGDGPGQVTTVRRGLIGMISGDETHRRTNEKPTRSTLAAYGLTATSGTKDGTNGSETYG
jgi:hypothetical protein